MDIGQPGGVGGAGRAAAIPIPQEKTTEISAQNTSEVDQRIVTRESVDRQKVAPSETSSKQESRPKVSDDIGRELAKQALERNDGKDSRPSNDGVSSNKKTRISF